MTFECRSGGDDRREEEKWSNDGCDDDDVGDGYARDVIVSAVRPDQQKEQMDERKDLKTQTV